MKSRRMKRAEHAAPIGETRKVYEILMVKPLQCRGHERDTIKMNLNEEYCEEGRQRGLCLVVGAAVSDVESLPSFARG
jgi:hypothetical protein